MKKSLSLLSLTALALLSPVSAQEAITPSPEAAPAATTEIQAQEVQPIALVSQEALDAALQILKQGMDQQNMKLLGLTQEIESQNALVKDGNGRVQEQTVLYEESSKRLDELNTQIKEAQETVLKLDQHVASLSQAKIISDADAAQRATKIDSLMKEVSLLQLAKTELSELVAALQARDEQLLAEIAASKASIEQFNINSQLFTAEIALLKKQVEQHEQIRKEQNTRLAMELAQLKLDLPAQKAAQDDAMSSLVSNMASGMVLIFLCLVVISAIFRKHLRNIKASLLDELNKKLSAAPAAIVAAAAPSKPQSRSKNASRKKNRPEPKPLVEEPVEEEEEEEEYEEEEYEEDEEDEEDEIDDEVILAEAPVHARSNSNTKTRSRY